MIQPPKQAQGKTHRADGLAEEVVVERLAAHVGARLHLRGRHLDVQPRADLGGHRLGERAARLFVWLWVDVDVVVLVWGGLRVEG